MNVAGHVETPLSLIDFGRTFADGEWCANVGRYAVRLSGPLGECKFVPNENGYLLDDGIDAEDVIAAARSLSASLSIQGLPHRIEVYDERDKLVLSLHNLPPW